MSEQNEQEQGEAVLFAVQHLHVFPLNIPFYNHLDFKDDLARNRKHFKRVWENYEIDKGFKQRDIQLRCATFLTCVGSGFACRGWSDI